jgi:hypothetical protein
MKSSFLKRFLLILFCLLAVLSNCKNNGAKQYLGAHIEFQSREYNLGTIPQNGEFDFSFNFINSGNSPLEILSLKASCGCTVLDQGTQQIAPNKSGNITGKFFSRQYKGKLVRTVSLTTNDPENSEVTLYINAIVEERKKE